MRLTAITRFSEKDLEPGEKILLRVRRHWVAFLMHTFQPLFYMMAVIVVSIVLVRVGILHFDLYYSDVIQWIIVGGLVAYYLFGPILRYYLDWRYDEDIITNKRLIDVDQNHLFGRDVGVTSLDRIEDISIRHHGLISTLFNYADIVIQTAGTRSDRPAGGHTFEMKDVPNTMRIQKIISEAVMAFREELYSQDPHHTHTPTPPNP